MLTRTTSTECNAVSTAAISYDRLGGFPCQGAPRIRLDVASLRLQTGRLGTECATCSLAGARCFRNQCLAAIVPCGRSVWAPLAPSQCTWFRPRRVDVWRLGQLADSMQILKSLPTDRVWPVAVVERTAQIFATWMYQLPGGER